MKLTEIEFNTLINTLPSDIELTSTNWIITDRGVTIAGRLDKQAQYPAEEMNPSLMLGSQHVDLTPYQKRVLSTTIFYKSSFYL